MYRIGMPLVQDAYAMTTYTNQAPTLNGHLYRFGTTYQGDFTSTTFGVGESNTNTNLFYAGLVKFDLSSIPATAIVTSATLSIWVASDDSGNARTWGLYRVLRN